VEKQISIGEQQTLSLLPRKRKHDVAESGALAKIQERLAEVKELADKIPTFNCIIGDKMHRQQEFDAEDIAREQRSIESIKMHASVLIGLVNNLTKDQSYALNRYMDDINQEPTKRRLIEQKQVGLDKTALQSTKDKKKQVGAEDKIKTKSLPGAVGDKHTRKKVSSLSLYIVVTLITMQNLIKPILDN